MKLRYRGIRYDRAESTLESTESNILARYRGNSYHVRNPQHVEIAQPSPLCKYRGVPYRQLADGSIGTVASSAQPADPSLVPMAARVARDELHRVHSSNLCKRLNERIKATRESGNDRLVAMLEREGRDLICFR